MKKFLSIFTFSLISTLLIAQSNQIIWQKTFGGSKNDFANRIRQTQDGGYIICGNTLSQDGDVHDQFGNFFYDAWVVKLDANKDTLWTHSYGGTYDEAGYDR